MRRKTTSLSLFPNSSISGKMRACSSKVYTHGLNARENKKLHTRANLAAWKLQIEDVKYTAHVTPKQNHLAVLGFMVLVGLLCMLQTYQGRRISSYLEKHLLELHYWMGLLQSE
jgi:hypothetical protein